MLNTLDDYICRSLPESGSLRTNPNLGLKVDGAGRFLPFYGNTAVFLLPDGVKSRLAELRDGLYSAAPELFAEPLDASTFHMTLHDLINGPDETAIAASMAEAEAKAGGIVGSFGDFEPIAMRATWTFNMVNTSIVLGLAPADDYGWRRLPELYSALEAVVPLGYALTPHITLGYFRPGEYGEAALSRLRSALGPVELELELRPEALVLQRFTDMNSYFTI